MNAPGQLPSAVAMAHGQCQPFLRPGSWALDATAGNGHDTLFLLEKTNPGGRVFAIDLQQEAIDATRQRIEQNAPALVGNLTLMTGCHASLATLLPPEAKGRLQAALFNLGYRPGGDKSLITQTDSTLTALAEALPWLDPAGMLSVVVYPGHSGGDSEARAVEDWASSLDSSSYRVAQYLFPAQPTSPRWIGITRKTSPQVP